MVMIQYIMMFLLTATGVLNAQDTKNLIVGDVSPSTSKMQDTAEDSEDDVIITDEDDSDDEE
jgi:hypothetical protein